MKVPEWILTPFDVEIGNADIASHLQEELIDMTVDLDSKCLVQK